MKELKAPPAHPVTWRFKVKGTDHTVSVEERTWFAARAAVSIATGKSPEELQLLE